MIVHTSRPLKVHEKKYPTHDLELADVVFELKLWSHYLYWVDVDVFNDHKSLQYVFALRNLNLSQRRWFELLKEYDMNVHYHQGKRNVVADAFSMLRRLSKQCVVDCSTSGVGLGPPRSESSFVVEVKKGLIHDSLLMELKDAMLIRINESFAFRGDDIVRYQYRFCVPDMDDLGTKIFAEAYGSRYSIHKGSIKIYHDVKQIYWWDGMMKHIAEYEARCPNCQQVKAEHSKPGGLAMIIEVPT